MLNKKYQVYAVSLALLSLGNIAAKSSDTAVHQEQSAIVAKKLQHQGMMLIDRLLFKVPNYGLCMELTSRRADTVLNAINRKREQVKREASAATDQEDAPRATINASDEQFIADSIDHLFKLIGSFLDTLRSQRSLLQPVVFESLGKERATELLAYFNTTGDIQEAVKKDIKTLDKLESVVGSLKQLFDDIAASLQPATEQGIKVLLDKIEAQQQASKK